MRLHHPDGYYTCPVPDEVIEQLRQFKKEHGIRWKAKLIHLWGSGKDEGLLRQARNMIGPGRLAKIDVEIVYRVKRFKEKVDA